MSFKFKISDDFEISYEDFREEGLRVSILARSGAGKSNLAALFIEQCLDNNVQVCIIEPIEEWYTLRTMYDSVAWVGEEGDIPLIPELHSKYVELLRKGCNLVITASTGDEVEDKKFVGSFLWSLYVAWKNVRRPLFLVVEEADTYAPQMWSREDRLSLSRMSLLAKRGRKLGINMITISQRPADIHKSIVSQSNILFIGGFKTTQDLNAVKTLSNLLHLPIPTEEVSKLSPGEFFTITRGEVARLKAYLRKTPHGGVTPTIEPNIRPDIREAITSVKEAVEREWERIREEQDMVKKLQRENEELRRKLEEYSRQLEMLKIVKEVPIELKVSQPVAEQGKTEPTPEIIHKCPYRGAIKVYEYLKNTGDFVKPKDIASHTGVGFETVKKIIRWMRFKGLVRTKLIYRYGKGYIKLVKLRT